jgi:hypothetical protein
MFLVVDLITNAGRKYIETANMEANSVSGCSM